MSIIKVKIYLVLDSIKNLKLVALAVSSDFSKR